MNTELPDSDITVLMLLEDDEYPVWPGYHDGETWRKSDDDSPVECRVIGWVHLNEAAERIDANGSIGTRLNSPLNETLIDARKRN